MNVQYCPDNTKFYISEKQCVRSAGSILSRMKYSFNFVYHNIFHLLINSQVDVIHNYHADLCEYMKRIHKSSHKI